MIDPLLDTVFYGLSMLGDAIGQPTFGIPMGNTKDLDDIYANATAAIELNPDDVNAYFRRAVVCQTRGYHEQALADFAEVLRRDRNNARAWLLTSEVLCKLGEYDRAKSARAQALALDPSLR